MLTHGATCPHHALAEDLIVPDLRILAKQMGRLELRLKRVENLCHRFTREAPLSGTCGRSDFRADVEIVLIHVDSSVSIFGQKDFYLSLSC